jgi:hypothetical protein
VEGEGNILIVTQTVEGEGNILIVTQTVESEGNRKYSYNLWWLKYEEIMDIMKPYFLN